MNGLTIALAILWASVLWAIVVGMPFVLTAATLAAGLAVVGRMGVVPGVVCLAAALTGDIVGRHFDRRAAGGGVKRALALTGGIAALGIAAGPDLGGLLAYLAMGRGGRLTLTRAAAQVRTVAISRLVRGGVAIGVAVWLFSGL